MSIFNAPAPSGSDDAAALQAALIACFGNRANPTDRTTFQKFRFQQGVYKVSNPLLLESVSGAAIEGAGRFATQILDTSGKGCFATNGFEYSAIRDMSFFGSAGTATLFDLNWDNTAIARQCALQSNTFENLFFAGEGSNSSIGLNIGAGGFMGSENLILNCFFNGCGVAGLKTSNYNALQQTVLGGDFQSCGKGIWVYAGSVPIIHGVGFQNSTAVPTSPWQTDNYDIHIQNAANDGYSIQGCRTQSACFFRNQNGPESFAHISGCTHNCANAGYFAIVQQNTVIDSCYSQNGQLGAASATEAYYLRNWNAGRADWQGPNFQLKSD
jgi:hypothetical protein